MSAPRRPNYVRFIGAGTVLGGILGYVLAVITPNPESYAETDGRGYLTLVFAAVGAILAAVVAVLVDQRMQKRRG